MCGTNRKPDCQQFEAGLRKVLADKHISHSTRGNCNVIGEAPVYYPYSNIGIISSSRKKKSAVEKTIYSQEEVENVFYERSQLNDSKDRSNLGDLINTNIAYVASIIELKIVNDKNYECHLCQSVFSVNEKLQQAFTSSHHSTIACISTFEICQAAEYFMKLDILKMFSINLICQAIISSLNIEDLYKSSDFALHAHDKLNLIEQISLQYVQYSGSKLSKSITDIKAYQDKMKERQKESIQNEQN